MAAERKGKKLRRVEPNRGYYKSQFGITDRNEKLKHGWHRFNRCDFRRSKPEETKP